MKWEGQPRVVLDHRLTANSLLLKTHLDWELPQLLTDSFPHPRETRGAKRGHPEGLVCPGVASRQGGGGGEGGGEGERGARLERASLGNVGGKKEQNQTLTAGGTPQPFHPGPPGGGSNP